MGGAIAYILGDNTNTMALAVELPYPLMGGLERGLILGSVGSSVLILGLSTLVTPTPLDVASPRAVSH